MSWFPNIWINDPLDHMVIFAGISSLVRIHMWMRTHMWGHLTEVASCRTNTRAMWVPTRPNFKKKLMKVRCQLECIGSSLRISNYGGKLIEAGCDQRPSIPRFWYRICWTSWLNSHLSLSCAVCNLNCVSTQKKTLERLSWCLASNDLQAMTYRQWLMPDIETNQSNLLIIWHLPISRKTI